MVDTCSDKEFMSKGGPKPEAETNTHKKQRRALVVALKNEKKNETVSVILPSTPLPLSQGGKQDGLSVADPTWLAKLLQDNQVDHRVCVEYPHFSYSRPFGLFDDHPFPSVYQTGVANQT